MTKNISFIALGVGICVLCMIAFESIKNSPSGTGKLDTLTSLWGKRTKSDRPDTTSAPSSPPPRLAPFSKDWSPEQIAKFNRARARFSRDYWSDTRLALYISDPDPQSDLDHPDVIARLLDLEKQDKEKPSYILPAVAAAAYVKKADTDLAHIVAAFASGTNKLGGVLDKSLLNAARNQYGDTPPLLYASLMAEKNFLTNLEDISKFRNASPQSGLPDLMEAAYWLDKGDDGKAYGLILKLNEKAIDDYGLEFQNEEIAYRVSAGESLRDALLAGSRIYESNEEILFSYLDTKISFPSGSRFLADPNSNWDELAAYAARISEWREQSGLIQSRINALDRQIEMAKLIQRGNKWATYYDEPYEEVQKELDHTYSGLKKQNQDLKEFISTASEPELARYLGLRSKLGEAAAMEKTIETRPKENKSPR